ncbi:hypothetical protein [Streptomyces sp. KAU_LT]|uniref:hypothetical protein n=1 Tax=Streptomyces sp. KAU_LT TaxID=3046669 RepID=UPI0024B6D476|nr:hypothetical protein [Streptomyces sp. KAU_LT]MDI9832546.1 hypothetical protein [Streptomyces sp. KAU_LT]
MAGPGWPGRGGRAGLSQDGRAGLSRGGKVEVAPGWIGPDRLGPGLPARRARPEGSALRPDARPYGTGAGRALTGPGRAGPGRANRGGRAELGQSGQAGLSQSSRAGLSRGGKVEVAPGWIGPDRLGPGLPARRARSEGSALRTDARPYGTGAGRALTGPGRGG